MDYRTITLDVGPAAEWLTTVHSPAGDLIAYLWIVTRDGYPVIDSVWTTPERRRHGWAEILLRRTETEVWAATGKAIFRDERATPLFAVWARSLGIRKSPPSRSLTLQEIGPLTHEETADLARLYIRARSETVRTSATV